MKKLSNNYKEKQRKNIGKKKKKTRKKLMWGKLCGIHIITYVMEVNNQLENKSQQPKLKVAMVGR